ncbi:DUF481 domain-containing protein [Sulfurimonas marina]|uniref:DUF481 domain-containing protein n=1 Tax=Sulfurimonas marina TaxID=2590551 RepID=A0A7M3V928_9BACT|nr:DUF481 domain-containing protein [Sulfurimonas marina]QOP40261.1 DUF481 domain-containing protein [Sulfurimonas marina]
MKKIVVGLAALASLTFGADVQTTEKPLKAHSELGYVQTSGNTETEAFNFELDIKKEWTKNVVTFEFDGQYATDKNVETKNKYTAELDYGYKFSERFSLNYLVGFKSDKFSGFRYQFYTGPGAKYKAIDQEAHKLSLEGNILYSVDQYEDVWVDALGTQLAYPYDGVVKDHISVPAYKDDYASYRIKGVYDWKILETLKFKQELSFRGSFEQGDKYFIYSKSAINNKINSIFSAGISYKVDYVNLPADGKQKTDRTFAVNLILDY